MAIIRLRKSHRHWLVGLARYLFLIVAAAITLIPFIYMISTSFTPPSETSRIPVYWIPPHPTFANYTYVLFHAGVPFLRWLFNSLFVATTATFVVVLVDALAAFGFARLRMPGRDLIFASILLSIMVPAAVTLIPVFLLMRDLHFLNTYNALVWPSAANAFGVFLLRQFFLTIPTELEEAAYLDGASKLRVFWSIDLPLVRNALVTLALLTWLASWNDFFWPLIALSDSSMYTAPVAITFLNSTVQRPGILLAAAMLIALPPLILYIIFQRRIREAVMTTGIAGR